MSSKIYRESRKIHQIEKGTVVFKVGGWAIKDKYLVSDIVEKIDDYDLMGFATITVYIEHVDNGEKKAWRRYNSSQCDVPFSFND